MCRVTPALTAVSVGLASALTIATSFGQPLPNPAKPEVTLPSTSELPRLLDLVALRLKVQIDYDPANPLLKGQQVTLRMGDAQVGAISNQELWATTSRLLVQRGLTTVRSPGSASLTVVKLEDAPRLARLELVTTPDAMSLPIATADAAAPEPVAGFRNQPVRLKNISLKEANDALRAMQRPSGGSGGGSLAPAAAASSSTGDLMLLGDTTPRIEEQLTLLRQMDTLENATVMLVVPASNVAPVQLAAAVAQLATRREAVSGEKLPGEVLAASGIQGAGGTAGGAAGSVLIVAPRRVVERWKEFIALADQRESVTTQTYAPRLFSVKEVASLMQQTAGSVTAAGSGDERFRVIAEEPTGSLIVTATPTQHEKITALMARLDSVPGELRRPVRSYLIRNRQVGEFVETLQRLVSAGVLEGSVELGGGGNVGGGSPSAALPSGMGQTPAANAILPPGFTPMVPTQGGGWGQTAARQEGRVRTAAGGGGGAAPLAITLTADESTNTLIAVGDGRVLDQLGVLIKTLDVRQAQVMVEAVMVSLAEDDSVALGVELQKVMQNGSTSVLLSSLFGVVPTGTSGGSGGGGPGGAAPFGGAAPPALAGGTALVINPGDYSAVINALQKVSNGRTVSRPKMLVINNNEATFNSVRQEPYAASFTAGNSSSPTTSFGGTQDAGTQMTVRPQISDGNTLLLDYNISISQFAGSAASANVPPPRQVTSVKSLATIPDGYTVVVSGLEAFSDGHNADQVPLLSQIPLIGELFKNQVNSKTKSKFYVFIQASVMRDSSLESLRYVSDAAANSASLPTSWPKSTPQVVR